MWAAKQTVSESENALLKAKNIKKEFEKNVQESGHDHFLRLRATEKAIDHTILIMQEIRDKNQEILETSLRNKAIASKITNTLWQFFLIIPC